MASKRHSSKRRGNPKKSRAGSKATRGGNFWLFISTRLLAGSFFVALVILIYLDLEIRHRFSGNIQAEPAHVYGRPVSLSKGQAYTAGDIAGRLGANGYRRADTLAEPGDFVVAAHAMDIFMRRLGHGDHLTEARAVRITFDGGVISGIMDHASGDHIAQADFALPLVGSLQLGPHKDRIALKPHEAPAVLLEALFIMEDRNFQAHYGVDPRAILRAAWSNLRHGRAVQGASTLTQQLIRNLFLNPQKNLGRKIIEAMMAVMLELRFSKAAILEMYLNEVFLGQSGNRAIHGFALASEYWFARPVNQLNVDEVAMLVGMIAAPSFYNPRKYPERALRRRNLVLDTLAARGVISAQSAGLLSQKPLGIVEHKSLSTSDFPSWLDYLHRQLRQYYSAEVLRENGLNLYTTIDVEIQKTAQQALSDTLARLERQKAVAPGVLQGAVIVVDPRSGEILALVGDRSRGYSGFNRAVDARRPVGSLVKPVVYLTALQFPEKYSLATLLDDSPLTLRSEGGGLWSPQNHDRTFRGPAPLYQGLVHSRNVPTVRLGLELGVQRVVDTMHRFGIKRDIADYPSTLLGASQHSPLEIAQLYQVIANRGSLIPLRTIRSIQNRRGRTVARFPVSKSRVIDSGSAFLIDHTLRMVVRQGTAAGLGRSFDARLDLAGKTGTTDDFRDSWFAGYSANLLTVVWVGRDGNQPVNLSGASGAMRVWEEIMSRLNLEKPGPVQNSNIVTVSIDPASGLVANRRCKERLNLPFIKGSEPQGFAPCSGLSGSSRSWLR